MNEFDYHYFGKNLLIINSLNDLIRMIEYRCGKKRMLMIIISDRFVKAESAANKQGGRPQLG